MYIQNNIYPSTALCRSPQKCILSTNSRLLHVVSKLCCQYAVIQPFWLLYTQLYMYTITISFHLSYCSHNTGSTQWMDPRLAQVKKATVDECDEDGKMINEDHSF